MGALRATSERRGVAASATDRESVVAHGRRSRSLRAAFRDAPVERAAVDAGTAARSAAAAAPASGSRESHVGRPEPGRPDASARSRRPAA